MTTPNQTTELDKAIESINHDFAEDNRPVLITVMRQNLNTVIDAAKRLKEVEKERDRWQETCHQLGHGEMSIKSINRDLEELSQLRTEYKQLKETCVSGLAYQSLFDNYKKALEALKGVEWSRPQQSNLRECPYCHKVIYLNDPKTHLKECALTNILSTPLAIATMKGE